MLKKVLSISGKPGLYKLVSQGKNMYIAESLADKKRIPVYTRDKVVSLGDIAIYTEAEEVPLSSVLTKIKEKEAGNKIVYDPKIQPSELRIYFESVLPEFDRERVYPSDIKKIMNWYNILVTAEMTDFEAVEEETSDSENDLKTEDEKES